MSADAIVFEKTKYTGKQPVFFGSPEVLPGTFKLKQAFANGTPIPKGTPIQLDFTLMEAGVVKVAKVVAGGTTTIPFVQKGHLLAVGDVVMKIGKTDLSVTVSAINTSNASYDAVTLSGAVATLAAGDFLQECSATAAAAVKGVYTLTIGTAPTADDKLTVNGIDYIFAAAAAENKIMIGANAIATAANLQDVLEADNQNFVVKANGAKLVFTQKVAGVGAIPTIAVVQTGGGTLAATIAETVASVALSVVAALYVADAVTSQDKTYDTNGANDVAASDVAKVLKGGAYPIPASFLNGHGLIANASVKYINQ